MKVIKIGMLFAFLALVSGCRSVDSSSIESTSLYSDESFEKYSKEAIDKYEIEVKRFTKVSPTELSTIINNNSDIIVYFERGTCPYCQQFVPILTSISSEQNKIMYYIDTELTEADIRIQ